MFGGGEKQGAFSTFSICILYGLNWQQQSLHPVQKKGVFSWPLLTAGKGVCPAMVVVSPVSQRIRVISTRLPREAQHRPDQH